MDIMTGSGHLIIILLLLRSDLMKLVQRIRRVTIEMKNGNGEAKK